MAESVPYRLRSEFPLLFGTTATTESLRVAFEHEDNEVAAHVMDEVQKLAFALFHLKVAHAKIRRNSKSVLANIAVALAAERGVGIASGGGGWQTRCEGMQQQIM